jgi:phosphoribosylformylglycinamidine cyclo-ligase
MADKYKTEIVDPGDAASKLGHKVCVDSYGNCKAVEVFPWQPGNFRGAVDFGWREHILKEMSAGKVKMTMQNDGAGGKPQFFTLLGSPEAFYNLGWEILVMCLDDVARSGGFPAVVCNDLNVKRVTPENYHLVDYLFAGYGEALAKCHVDNITGELAIMKHSITAFCDFNKPEQLVLTWGGTCLGLTSIDKRIDGSGVRVGQPLVGFFEPGYRCNGGTFFTNLILAVTEGNLERIQYNLALVSLIKKLTIPSVSYARLISYVNGWKDDGSTGEALVKMTGIAHITGGGIWHKLADMLPEGCGADLNNMFPPAGVLTDAQDLSWDFPEWKLSDLQAHGTFHGGSGMIVACASNEDAEQLIINASDFGIKAKVIGQVIASPTKEIVIKSRFREGRILSSHELK